MRKFRTCHADRALVPPAPPRRLAHQRRDDLNFQFPRVLERVEIDECNLGDGVGVGAGQSILRVEFGVASLILVMLLGMVLVFVIIRVVFVFVMLGMIFVRFFAFQFGTGLSHRAFGLRRQHEQLQRAGQHRDRRVDGRAILGTLCGMLESDDVCAGRVQFHRNGAAVESNVEFADTMFMGVQLSVLLGRSGECDDGEDERKVGSHDGSFDRYLMSVLQAAQSRQWPWISTM